MLRTTKEDVVVDVGKKEMRAVDVRRRMQRTG